MVALCLNRITLPADLGQEWVQRSAKNLSQLREMREAVVRSGEKWSDPKRILKVKSTGFAGGLEVRCEKEESG